ncbi:MULTISPECIES: tRNA (adenosine(37)-N6)-threonylcarbamoyltransferase complex ATPase subunit type 1 TsaE [Vagococcus]|uniref:tRNA (adenosine(37)-N6)-threonylcarbamoyltransferase complex ATPase subunit type 1 TsaE n=1 Tax=Vagococcus TaxID=2737 RepID=UPI000E4729B7|nr:MULTISPECIES: tRNA (adenosine(37)-N6)-threonylcarbamoyltransferase complex ATPase subunit type 1 TsaE [Vagococcus]RHH69085.1 tRNA (adenosine(37)-N6)-threonylcarbamoyltransferase complex ATPase subunit type 1 TsaE [Vagococcus sp. AM17-17]
MTVYLNNDDQTQRFGEQLASLAKPGDIFILTGELGAGKTTFSKGFAKGLGIKQMIKSPTYTLIREYDTGRLPLYHMDVYRIEGDASDLGLEEYFDGDGVCLIEWGEIIKDSLDNDFIEIFLHKTPEDTRFITVEHRGAKERFNQITDMMAAYD